MPDSNKTQDIVGNIAPALLPLAVPVESLSPDPANARMHPEKNIDRLKASLKAYGQQKPVVVDANGVLIAGSGTLEAVQQLGWSHIAAVKSNLKGAERVAYAIADNRTAELAEWDDDALAQQLAALQDDDSIDHLAAGFDDDEIAALTSAMADSDGFEPVGQEDQPRLDEKDPVECPECGHKFIWDPWAK